VTVPVVSFVLQLRAGCLAKNKGVRVNNLPSGLGAIFDSGVVILIDCVVIAIDIGSLAIANDGASGTSTAITDVGIIALTDIVVAASHDRSLSAFANDGIVGASGKCDTKSGYSQNQSDRV
jgi:hypothetical protein